MRNGLGWNRCCPIGLRVGVGSGRITGWCSTGCCGGLGVVSRGGRYRRRSGTGRLSLTGITAGQATEPWPVLEELRRDADAAEGPDWTIGVDGAVVRAHQHAAGARHAPPADIPAEVVATTELDTRGRVE
jgi:hypothetical protein